MSTTTPDSPHLHANQEGSSEDPTGTKTLRRKQSQHFSSRWATVRGILRKTLEKNDALRLRDIDHGPETMNIPGTLRAGVVDDFGAESNSDRLSRFSEWFRKVLEAHVLEPTSEDQVKEGRHYTSDAIDKAYARGLAISGPLLTKAGYEVDSSPSDLISEDRHQDNLGSLRLQTYSDVERATSETHTQQTRDLSTGLGAVAASELTIRGLTNDLTEQVDTVGQTRTELTTHTRVIDAVNTAALEQYTAAGVSEVGVTVEWATAGDFAVCPDCAALGNSTYSLSEVRSGQAPRPPIHPRCRCLLTPT